MSETITDVVAKSRRMRRSLFRVEDIDFYLVGPGHSGTTSLNRIINQHPDIFIPPESNFLTWTHRINSITTYFGANEALVFGEHGNNYFSFDGVPAKIAAANPKAKIIVVVQDPIKRIIRNYRHDIRWGVLGRFISLRVALQPNFLQFRYIRPSLYVDNLRRWLEHFSPAQIFLYSSDDKHDRSAAIADLFGFLGVGVCEVDMSMRENESVFTLLPMLHRHATFGKAGVARNFARVFEPVNRLLGGLIGAPKIDETDYAEMQTMLGEHASLEPLRKFARKQGLRGAI